jgi:hypothetical protein
MKAETWLARCAAELQHLSLTNPHDSPCGMTTEHGKMDLAAELIGSQRYLGLDPVQAARTFWRDDATSTLPT